MNYKFLDYVACFITGMVILILELTSFRLFAPYFGNSSYVIGVLINTTLLALAIGYLIGGYTADKFKSNKLPYLIILGVDVYLAIIFPFYPNILKAMSTLSVILGAFLSVTIMFFIPMVFLAFIPPYLIKILSINKRIGIVSGKIFSISTLGSIVGGVLTTFAFIPSLGSRFTFLISIIILLIIAVIGLIRLNKLFLLCTFLLIIPLISKPKSTNSQIIFQTESEYNTIYVVNDSKSLFLKLNNNEGFHSKSIDPKTGLTNSLYDYFLIPQILINANQTLVLGNGAGTMMSQISYFFDTHIDGVEIDPKLTEIGKDYFGLDLTNDKLRIFYEDARTFLIKNNKKYDIINIDIYSGSAYVPFHVVTVEFFKLVNESLNEGGVLVINMPHYSIGTPLGHHYLNTVTKVFPNSYIYGHILYAFKSNIDKSIIIKKFEDTKTSNALNGVIKKFLSGFKNVDLQLFNDIFLDDFAPIEKMTFDIKKE